MTKIYAFLITLCFAGICLGGADKPLPNIIIWGVPTINGMPVNYAPNKVLESPFLNADYNSGVVSISRKKTSHTLDFAAH